MGWDDDDDEGEGGGAARAGTPIAIPLGALESNDAPEVRDAERDEADDGNGGSDQASRRRRGLEALDRDPARKLSRQEAVDRIRRSRSPRREEPAAGCFGLLLIITALVLVSAPLIPELTTLLVGCAAVSGLTGLLYGMQRIAYGTERNEIIDELAEATGWARPQVAVAYAAAAQNATAEEVEEALALGRLPRDELGAPSEQGNRGQLTPPPKKAPALQPWNRSRSARKRGRST